MLPERDLRADGHVACARPFGSHGRRLSGFSFFFAPAVSTPRSARLRHTICRRQMRFITDERLDRALDGVCALSGRDLEVAGTIGETLSCARSDAEYKPR